MIDVLAQDQPQVAGDFWGSGRHQVGDGPATGRPSLAERPVLTRWRRRVGLHNSAVASELRLQASWLRSCGPFMLAGQSALDLRRRIPAAVRPMPAAFTREPVSDPG